jgi:hypothetical protein
LSENTELSESKAGFASLKYGITSPPPRIKMEMPESRVDVSLASRDDLALTLRVDLDLLSGDDLGLPSSSAESLATMRSIALFTEVGVTDVGDLRPNREIEDLSSINAIVSSTRLLERDSLYLSSELRTLLSPA